MAKFGIILSFTCREIKTAQNAAKSVLKIKLLSDGGPWQMRSFSDLAVQVLGWWVTATTPVRRANLNPLRSVLGEVLQVRIAPLERQFPE